MNANIEKAREIFVAAVGKLSPEEWDTYLAEVCAGDVELSRRVKRLLQLDAGAGSFLESPAAPALATVDDPMRERPGTVIGPYKLVEQIGEGGMGTVWMAQQTEPVKRLVALKVIKPGMDSRQVIARFEAERQALALMDHPNIARVFEAGTTDSGRPYFVMELVKGVPLTRYCDEHRLTPKERLELFIPVCQAIQHAHQKGIIHRDIKPSNVLVALYDGKPVPKVIDFGIAKATGQQLTEHTLITGFGAVVGTLEYMSPEQAELNQLDIDTRSDIYGLGVLLYELLTGTTPLDRKRLKEAAMLEVLRIIREEEPPRPSTRLSTTEELPSVAANRGLEPKKLSGLVRGELDWIVMKALEKDRNRRYETANGLAMDVRRYLSDEPVQACPPSAVYRLRKFARKYRMPLRIAGGFVVVLVLATAVSTWQAIRATRERDRAAASFRMARDAVDRLFTQVSQSPQLKGRGMEKFRKDLLQNAREFYERFIREQFDSAGTRYDLGLAYQRLTEINRELGDVAGAEEAAAKATALLGELAAAHSDVPEYQRDLAATHAALGLVYVNNANWDKADAAYQRSLAILENLVRIRPHVSEFQYALAQTYSALGIIHHRVDRPDSAAAMSRRAQATLNALLQENKDNPRVSEYKALLAETQRNLGEFYLIEGALDEAEKALKEAQSLYAELAKSQDLPEYWHSLARSQIPLGEVYNHQQATLSKAEETQQQAVKIFTKLRNEHPLVPEYAYGQGRAYGEMAKTADMAGRFDVALDRFDKSIEILNEGLGNGFLRARPALVDVRIYRAGTLAKKGDHARATHEAEAVGREKDLQSVQLYNIACVFARSSAAAQRDSILTATERMRLKALYAKRAMAFLPQAIAKGWRYLRVIRNDPDLESLRAREDFHKLLAELEAKTKE